MYQPKRKGENQLTMHAHRVSACCLLFALVAGCGSDTEDPANGGQGGSGSSAGNGGAASGGSSSGGSGATTVPLRIAAYNAQNFFNDELDGEAHIIPSQEEESTQSTQSYKAELSGTASLLNLLQADIVLFSEVENEAVLRDLIAWSTVEKQYVDVALIPGNDTRGIDQGLISTVPIDRVVTHQDEVFSRLDQSSDSFSYTRDAIEVHLTYEGHPLVFLGVHFRSQLFDNEDKRIAEAQHTRFLADQLLMEDPNRGVIILGDFNDELDSVAGRALLGDPAACQCSGPAFEGVVDVLSDEDSWTLWAGGDKLHYDDILLSPGLQGWLDRDSVRVFHDDELGSQAQRSLSDHSPVVATLNLPILP